MRTAVVSLTRRGAVLAKQIANRLQGDAYIKREFLQEFPESMTEAGGERPTVVFPVEEGFTSFVGTLFKAYDGIVFIMACGIVVRAIAPYVRDKRSDPAVVVMDEKGQYAISVLSGHIGGANELALRAAAITGGVPVITTATDVNGVIAFDALAEKNNCVIENIEMLKYVSARLVDGGKVGLLYDCGLDGTLPDNIITDRVAVENIDIAVVLSNRTNRADLPVKTLYLRPRNLILGMGCRRGTPKEQIACAVESFMKSNDRSLLSVKCVASVDIKKDEAGILEFCRERGLDACFVSTEEIGKLEGSFEASEFVRETIGVGAVAVPSALLCGSHTKLVCGKTIYKGITLALAEEETTINL
jgi:cobalt-precorrin 5A hydrolase